MSVICIAITKKICWYYAIKRPLNVFETELVTCVMTSTFLLRIFDSIDSSLTAYLYLRNHDNNLTLWNIVQMDILMSAIWPNSFVTVKKYSHSNFFKLYFIIHANTLQINYHQLIIVVLCQSRYMRFRGFGSSILVVSSQALSWL